MEFGSDFHKCNYPIGKSLLHIYHTCNLYIDGRQALIDIAINNKWNILWIPSYYCYEFIEAISPYSNIQIYDYTPFEDISLAIKRINCDSNDAIIIPNFYGISTPLSQIDYPQCIVIEDHSHDLISDWARNSKADWCFASLRKTLPIADGGILWSPRGHNLPRQPIHTINAERLADRRYLAMSLKAQYLNGNSIDKEFFRSIYIETENSLNDLPISSISKESYKIISTIDIVEWYHRKKVNWEYINGNMISNDKIKILSSSFANLKSYPFSVILKCSTEDVRDSFKAELIKNNIYPAILWNIPDTQNIHSKQFSSTMLSLHCDARYTIEDIKGMVRILNNVIKCLK